MSLLDTIHHTNTVAKIKPTSNYRNQNGIGTRVRVYETQTHPNYWDYLLVSNIMGY